VRWSVSSNPSMGGNDGAAPGGDDDLLGGHVLPAEFPRFDQRRLQSRVRRLRDVVPGAAADDEHLEVGHAGWTVDRRAQ
jgi:hypothetical protein